MLLKGGAVLKSPTHSRRSRQSGLSKREAISLAPRLQPGGQDLKMILNPDGSIGRYRRHWPKVNADIVARGIELQKAVRAGHWQVPSELRADEYRIIEVTAGVGHSGFADPGFRADAVVRVLFRKTAKGTQYPISSTGYRYFNKDGKEVRFSRFPELPASTRKKE
jgi:hypothetical protein